MTQTASGGFTVTMTPGEEVVPGSGRLDFTKTWTGGIAGTGSGVMISGGDPQAGSAGYVAFEVFEGTLAGRVGGCAMQQYGQMVDGGPELRYEIVPGSGTGELAGITGSVELTVVDGDHRVVVHYDL